MSLADLFRNSSVDVKMKDFLISLLLIPTIEKLILRRQSKHKEGSELLV